MVASVSLFSVSAIDYGSTPTYEKPVTKVSDGTGEIGKTAEAPAEVVTDGGVKEALKAAEPVIYVAEKTAEVKESAIGEIAKSEKPVTFVTPECTIKIDPAKIKEVKAIDLGMEVTAAKEETVVSGTKVPAGSIVINPAQKGDFGMELEITISKTTLGEMDASKAKLYYISDDGKVTEMGAFKVNADGSLTLAISHASEYVVSDKSIASASVETEAAGLTASEPAATQTVANPKTGNVAVVAIDIAALAAVCAGGVLGISFWQTTDYCGFPQVNSKNYPLIYVKNRGLPKESP